jgi:predicted transposase/invertase (TIGR01784 family)
MIGDKSCRLDICMTVNGQRVDLEVQVGNEGNYPERAMFNWAREYSTALPSGQDYSLLPRAIVISIINFKLFGCEEYHSKFLPLEEARHELLSDKMVFHFYELPKIPKEVSRKNMLLLWLSLFKADTKEELEKIKAMEVPVMDQAISAYYTITASSEFRERERLWEKARHDEAQALRHARLEGEEKERAKWQGVVADKDAEIARLRAEISRK